MGYSAFAVSSSLNLYRMILFVFLVSEISSFYLPGGKGYDPEKADYSDFEAWLQCYYVDGMKSVRDHNGRTMWFKVSGWKNTFFPLCPRILLNFMHQRY